MATTLESIRTNEPFLYSARRGLPSTVRGTVASSARSPPFVNSRYLRTEQVLPLR
jgi:hypothetical protein